MTDLPSLAARLVGKPSVALGLRVCSLAAWMRNCKSGKKVVEGVRMDTGQTRPPRSELLKSRGCDTTTGVGGSFSGWSSESWERKGLGRSDSGGCPPLGKMHGTEFREATDIG